MTQYIMTADQVRDMRNDYADNVDANYRSESLAAGEDAEGHTYLYGNTSFWNDDPAWSDVELGPDMCIYCDSEVTENHCWNCNEYKGIVDWDTYNKMGH